jgi:SAM-dependent methyltransferase
VISGIDTARRTTASDFSALEAQEIARIAATSGWRRAAHDYMRSRNHAAYRRAVDEYVAPARFLLPIDRASNVLHIGCGWGALSINLAHCSASTVALDDRLSRLYFLGLRGREAAISTLQPVCAPSSQALPFADSAFDAVILSAPPNPDRLRLLEEVRRVLRPRGCLLLMLANSAWASLGEVCRHPNVLATYWACRAQLQKIGFVNLAVYAPFPSLQEPLIILQVNRPRLIEHCLNRVFTTNTYRARLEARGLGPAFALARLTWPVVRRLGIVNLARFFVPAFYVTAQA